MTDIAKSTVKQILKEKLQEIHEADTLYLGALCYVLETARQLGLITQKNM